MLIKGLYHLGALALGLGGALGLLALLAWMNQSPPPAPAEGDEAAVAIQLAPPPPPPPQARVPPPPAPRPPEARPAPRGRTPPPSLLSGLAGVELGGLAPLAAAPVSGLRQGLLGDPRQDLVMTEDAVDTRPRRQACPPAPYPQAARAQGIKGHVVLRLLIGADGAVERIKVLEAEPPGVFEAGAQQAMERCRFEPARYQGKPVKVWAEQRLVFKLGVGG